MARNDILLLAGDDAEGDVLADAVAALAEDLTLYRVSDAAEAVAFLTRCAPFEGGRRPDLVILDIVDGRTEAEAVIQTVRMDPELAVVPVVVLTGSDAAADIERIYAARANAYHVKPAQPSDVRDLVGAISTFWLRTACLAGRD